MMMRVRRTPHRAADTLREPITIDTKTFACVPSLKYSRWILTEDDTVVFHKLSAGRWHVASHSPVLQQADFPLETPLDISLRDIAGAVAGILGCQPTLSQYMTHYVIGTTGFRVSKISTTYKPLEWQIRASHRSDDLVYNCVLEQLRARQQSAPFVFDTRAAALKYFRKLYVETVDAVNEYHLQPWAIRLLSRARHGSHTAAVLQQRQ